MSRFEQDLIPGPIEGYKIVRDDMTCSPNGNTFKFQIGRNKLPNDNPLELCKNGFHFCMYPSGVWAYHSQGKVFKVKAYGVLPAPVEPGADYKLVCEEIELCEEITIDGDRNTGDRNTGNGNAGYGNTGDRNTGDENAGYGNAGDGNTGYRNTGDENAGDRNTGDRNAGDGNTGNGNTGNGNTGYGNAGDRNTGDRNTGNGNTGDFHSGSLNYGEAPIYLFNKITKIKRSDLPWGLINKLSCLLQKDGYICPDEFLEIPNATVKRIKALHEAHISARKARKQ